MITTHKIELTKDGYEKLESRIQEIEDLASSGMFSDKDVTQRFQELVLSVKKLRQTIRDVFFIVPSTPVSTDTGDAA